MMAKHLNLVLLVSVALSIQLVTGQEVTPVTVTTKMGEILGERTPYEYSDEFVTVNTSVDIFRGIPYAKPPVDDLRFAKPEEMDPWGSETYNATYFRDRCWQSVETNISGQDQSEDCLHLNIYTPNAEGSGYPVLVRIHGGAFVGGDGISPPYDGRPIVGVHGVVLVTIHYRLNAFGFLTTGEPSLIGNFGLWDQNMALKWIKENIANFGGDADQITILGLSAGGASVGFHLIAEDSWDYFNRAVLISGTMVSPWGLETDIQKATDDAYLLGRLAGCGNATTGLQLRNCLRKVSAEQLMIASTVVGLTTTHIIPLVPTIDGEFITEDPRILLQKKKFKMCDVIIGETKDDGAITAMGAYRDQLFTDTPTSDYATFIDKVTQFTYTYTNDIIVNSIAQQYVDWKDFDNETTNYFYKYVELITDEAFHCPGEHTARAYATSGMDVYRYFFNFLSPRTEQFPSWYGVGHGNDLQYIFASFMNPRELTNFTDTERQFSLDMMRYYANFAKNGDPNLPEDTNNFPWEPFTVPGLNVLEEKPEFAAIPGARAEFNAFWNGFLPTLVTYSADLPEAEHQWREEFNRWKNDDLPAWRQDFNEYQDSNQCDN